MDINTIIDLQGRTPGQIINSLRDKATEVPSWAKLKKAYYPKYHPVMDKTLYPDFADPETGEAVSATRVTYDLQRLAAKRLTELCFGVPVKRVYEVEPGDAESQHVADIMEKIFKSVRIDSVNVKRGLQYFAACETMTLWYSITSEHLAYGEKASMKLRCVNYSPMQGDTLYPLFDEYGDLVALSVQYSRKQGGKTYTYFDAYTAEHHYKWSNDSDSQNSEETDDSKWQLVDDNPIVMGKIPAIYLSRETPAWEDTDNLVYEMEWAMSRNGNYIRDNSRPLFVVFADEEIPFGNEPAAHKSGKSILKYPRGSSAQYVTWSQSTDALKFHVSELRQMFFTQLQLPDWSFENMKSTPMSGESMRQMYVDAIMKVGDESGALVEALDREVNVVKSFMKLMFPKYSEKIDALRVNNVITPCTVDSSAESIDERSGESDGTKNMAE